MLCWGSWANTQKLASKNWAFQLFYWDYAMGLVLLSLILGLTLGSQGTPGRSFIGRPEAGILAKHRFCLCGRSDF